jgi:LPS sulfotransferase NodH
MGRPVILYIAGLGRSGSTVLGDALATLPGFCAVGETHHIWQRGCLENWRCGDGPDFADHPIWQAAVAAAKTQRPGAPIAQRAALVQRLKRARHNLSGLSHPADRAAYQQDFDAIYTSLAQSLGARVLIDTGKWPFHARIMQSSAAVDLRVLHLSRDPCAVAFSRRTGKATPGPQGTPIEMKPQSAARLALRWRWRTWQVQRLAKGGPYARIAYEAFVTDPATSLGRAFGALGLALPPDALDSLATGAFDRRPSIAFSGNPNRMHPGRVTLRADQRWQTGLPAPQKALVRGLTLTSGRLS